MRKRVTEQDMFGVEPLPLDDLARETEAECDAERLRRVRCYERCWLEHGRLGEDFMEALEEGRRLLDRDAALPETFVTFKGAQVRRTAESRLCSRCNYGEASPTRDDGLCGNCRWTVRQAELRQIEVSAGLLFECDVCKVHRRPSKARGWCFSGGTLCQKCNRKVVHRETA